MFILGSLICVRQTKYQGVHFRLNKPSDCVVRKALLFIIYIVGKLVYNSHMNMRRIIDKFWKLVVLIVLEVVISYIALWQYNSIATPIQAISDAIVVLCIFIVGITIIKYGSVIGERKYNTLGFAIFLLAVFIVIERFEGFAVKISAFAVLLVAFAAFMSIEESRRLRDDNRRIREEALIQERHRLALERIRSWAEDAISAIIAEPLVFSKISMEKLSRSLQPSRVKALGIITEGGSLGGELQSSSAKAHNTLLIFGARLQGEESITQTRYLLKIKDKIEPIQTKEELLESMEELFVALKNLITSATNRLMVK